MPSIEEAKDRLDLIINKGRVHLYKPIQIAEVLYHSRVGDAGIDVNRLDTYRSKSKHWRDDVCIKILRTSSTSSARYQDNIWEENAMTPELLAALDAENKSTGVTNAADRGLDMWANFGTAIQVKHLALDADKTERIVDQIESDDIVIVCQSIAKSVIENLLSQTSWFSRVKGIVTEEELINWYERCLRGQYATILARTLLDRLSNEFKKEFPQAATIVDFLEERHYLKLEPPERWVINLLQDLQNATEVE